MAGQREMTRLDQLRRSGPGRNVLPNEGLDPSSSSCCTFAAASGRAVQSRCSGAVGVGGFHAC